MSAIHCEMRRIQQKNNNYITYIYIYIHNNYSFIGIDASSLALSLNYVNSHLNIWYKYIREIIILLYTYILSMLLCNSKLHFFFLQLNITNGKKLSISEDTQTTHFYIESIIVRFKNIVNVCCSPCPEKQCARLLHSGRALRTWPRPLD